MITKYERRQASRCGAGESNRDTWAMGSGAGPELGGHLHASVKSGCYGPCWGFLGLGGVTPPFRNKGSPRIRGSSVDQGVTKDQSTKDYTIFTPQVRVQS